ncbi:hypothetical protein BKA80DRAFT_268933 [Phyllosticta citrichinensis]
MIPHQALSWSLLVLSKPLRPCWFRMADTCGCLSDMDDIGITFLVWQPQVRSNHQSSFILHESKYQVCVHQPREVEEMASSCAFAICATAAPGSVRLGWPRGTRPSCT